MEKSTMPLGGEVGSHYGHNMLTFVADFKNHISSAADTAQYFLTHGHRYPAKQAVASLGVFDQAAFSVLTKYPDLSVTPTLESAAQTALVMYVNSLCRLHIRKIEDEVRNDDTNDPVTTIGYVACPPKVTKEITAAFVKAAQVEERNFQRVKSALDTIHKKNELADVLEQVIDHVAHVEAVGFYVGDRFFARMERFTNLIDSAKNPEGFLTRLREKNYLNWSRDEILVVAALHSLFLSGRSVRFEEFNGASLTATALLDKLYDLLQLYKSAGCDCEVPVDVDVFDLARTVRDQSTKAQGSNWLRYRWVYGLNFQKTERILHTTQSTEDPATSLREFEEDYEDLVNTIPTDPVTESQFFYELARASLERDVAGVPCAKSGEAATGWLEYLIEKIVATAVIATRADYGMSSSLRDISCLVESDETKLIEVIHALQNVDFFTCFVAIGFRNRMEKRLADTIAQSVQRRMMFNRWHFIPGNFERGKIAKSRHWYYPPVLPDIAIHSDVHHAGHARAQVKYSVRAPGPDMSMSPLLIANRPYRGFYDVRVVRMEGEEFTTDDLLRARRRTLWMEPVYSALVEYLTRTGSRLPIVGFQPGQYLDIEARSMYAV